MPNPDSRLLVVQASTLSIEGLSVPNLQRERQYGRPGTDRLPASHHYLYLWVHCACYPVCPIVVQGAKEKVRCF